MRSRAPLLLVALLLLATAFIDVRAGIVDQYSTADADFRRLQDVTVPAALRERLGADADRWMGRVLDLPPTDASSTDARAALSRGERPEPHVVLPAVTDYALRHGLYRDAR
mgnify:CR=1 FL=1